MSHISHFLIWYPYGTFLEYTNPEVENSAFEDTASICYSHDVFSECPVPEIENPNHPATAETSAETLQDTQESDTQTGDSLQLITKSLLN